ncbi:MAG: tetraacyldisaccharide 4'-kinase [Bacteroidota bacterium]
MRHKGNRGFKGRVLLWPLGILYGLVMWGRNVMYNLGILPSWKAPVPVISIGNLSVGGTGKTPIAAYVMSFLAEKKIRVAYLSRGYGRRTKGYLKVDPKVGDAEHYGDEACQIAANFPDLPVAVCEDRKVGIQHLVEEEGAELVVLDDAFQHRAVARDLNIVVIDANRPYWQDMILPAGRLREFAAGLNRADVLVVNKIRTSRDISIFMSKLASWGGPFVFCQPTQTMIRSFHSPTATAISDLSEQNVVAFAGIGNPTYFFDQLGQTGMKILDHRIYKDHHPYIPKNLEDLEKILSTLPLGTILLTTEKDYFRMRNQPWTRAFTHLPLYYVDMQLTWPGVEAGEDNLLVQSLLQFA